MPIKLRKLSTNTLVGRVREQALLEEQHDVGALYQLIDPTIRLRRRERDDEPDLTLAEIREFVSTISTADVEEVQILEARKVSSRHGDRPAALVRSVIRYNHDPTPQQFRTIWVRDSGIWYSTALGKRSFPAA